MMYGERDDPYAVITRLGQRLEASLPSETLLSTVVESVTHALKLPGASIWLVDDQTSLRLAATFDEKRLEGPIVADRSAITTLRHATTGLRSEQFENGGVFHAALRDLGADLTLPLLHQGELVGARTRAAQCW
jgi:hypothetical protein